MTITIVIATGQMMSRITAGAIVGRSLVQFVELQQVGERAQRLAPLCHVFGEWRRGVAVELGRARRFTSWRAGPARGALAKGAVATA